MNFLSNLKSSLPYKVVLRNNVFELTIFPWFKFPKMKSQTEECLDARCKLQDLESTISGDIFNKTFLDGPTQPNNEW